MKNILLMFVVTFAFAGYAFGECSQSDKQALEAFDRAWGDAGVRGDRAALMTVYADDYVGLPDMQNKTQTIEGTMAQFELAKANPNTGDMLTHDNYMITCTPASAVITHRNIFTTKNGAGKEEASWSRSVHFLEKRGGKWQAISSANHGLDDYGVLMYMEHDWSKADVKRDMSWYERNFAADYSGISSRTTRILTKAEEIAGFKNSKSVIESGELSELNIRIDGNTAIVTGVNHIKGRDDKNQPMNYRLRFTDTFIKRDGRWQVWASQWAPMQ